jgi:phosphoglycolate phosphatase
VPCIFCWRYKLPSLKVAEYVLLFDIDGTLIDSAGAGGEALLLAAQECFRRPDMQPVALHGRTDRGIMADMLESAGIAATDDNIANLRDNYLQLLPTELAQRSGLVLPGVVRLLDELAANPRCHLGLVTGNMPEAARLKLEHFGLWNYFKFGVFGHETPHRRELSDPAWNFVRAHATNPLPEHVVVIGDTPLDVDLALTMQVRCLAVCTGGCDATTLRSAGAHCVVENLTDTKEILRWLIPAFTDQPHSEKT